MSKLTDKQWIELVRKTVEYVNGGLRMGQSYMNALGDIDMSLYRSIVNTEFDCYYNDDKLINFIKHLSGE